MVVTLIINSPVNVYKNITNIQLSSLTGVDYEKVGF